MTLQLTLLGSGSTGNATLVSCGDTHVLVDVGLSGKETARRLGECGLSPEKISAVIVSHEHGDHCRGVRPFAQAFEVPVFMTDGAFEASGMRLDRCKKEPIEAGVPFDVHGLLFTPFPVPHDAADPIAFTIEKDGVKVAIVLDLGFMSNLVIERLRGCDAIVLESNHDVNMLKVGPYPWSLKQRVMSRQGHLSNDSVAEYLSDGFDGRARYVILAHLSKKNNLPELAELSASRALENRLSIACVQTKLELANPEGVGRTYGLG